SRGRIAKLSASYQEVVRSVAGLAQCPTPDPARVTGFDERLHKPSDQFRSSIPHHSHRGDARRDQTKPDTSTSPAQLLEQNVNANGRQSESAVALGNEGKVITQSVGGREDLHQSGLSNTEGVCLRTAIDRHGCGTHHLQGEVMDF